MVATRPNSGSSVPACSLKWSAYALTWAAADCDGPTLSSTTTRRSRSMSTATRSANSCRFLPSGRREGLGQAQRAGLGMADQPGLEAVLTRWLGLLLAGLAQVLDTLPHGWCELLGGGAALDQGTWLDGDARLGGVGVQVHHAHAWLQGAEVGAADLRLRLEQLADLRELRGQHVGDRLEVAATPIAGSHVRSTSQRAFAEARWDRRRRGSDRRPHRIHQAAADSNPRQSQARVGHR